MDLEERARLVKLYSEMSDDEIIQILIEDKEEYNRNPYEAYKLVMGEAMRRGLQDRLEEKNNPPPQSPESESELEPEAYDGEVTTYFPTGGVFTKSFYKNNLLDGEYWEYSEDGKLVEKGFYKDDIRNGTFEYYDEFGRVGSKVVYREGFLSGPYEAYYENGALSVSAVFDGDLPHGEAKLYDECGKLLLVQTYRNGVVIKSVKQPGVYSEITLEFEDGGFVFEIG